MTAYRGDSFAYNDRAFQYGEAAIARAVMAQLAWGRPAAVMVDPRMQAYPGRYDGYQTYPNSSQYSYQNYYPESHHGRRHHHHHDRRFAMQSQYFDDAYADSRYPAARYAYADSRYSDPRYAYGDSRYSGNRYAYTDTRYSDPRYAYADSRYSDPRYAYGDSRYTGNRYDEYGITSQYGRATYNNRRAYADGSHAMENALIVASTARRLGFSREQTLACIATMLVESRGDHRRIGDSGHSVGLFQLHDQGEGAGMSVAQRMNPALNARIALSEFTRHRYGGDPGTWAASAQRPKDRYQFASLVNSQMSNAHRLLSQCEQSYGMYA